MNETQRFGAILEGLEKVTYLICRCAIIEALYLKDQTTSTNTLEKTLTDLYGAILLFILKAKRYFGQSMPCRRQCMSLLTLVLTFVQARVAKSLILLPESDVNKLLDDIDGKRIEVQQCVDLAEAECQLSTVYQILG